MATSYEEIRSIVQRSGLKQFPDAAKPLLSRDTNITNGIAPIAPPVGDSNDEYSALLATSLGTNIVVPSPAQSDDAEISTDVKIVSSPELQSAEDGNLAETVEPVQSAPQEHTPDDPQDRTSQRVINYVRVDFFDNGPAPNEGKSKHTRYKANIHLNETPGAPFTKFPCSFHNRSRDFGLTIPNGYERDEFYLNIDYVLTHATDGNEEFEIKPTAGKLRDENNHVIPHTAALLWQVKGEPICVVLYIDDFTEKIALDQNPKGRRKCSRLIAMGVYQNPETIEQQQASRKQAGQSFSSIMDAQRKALGGRR